MQNKHNITQVTSESESDAEVEQQSQVQHVQLKHSINEAINQSTHIQASQLDSKQFVLWVIIGSPGAGKSTALLSAISGIEFIKTPLQRRSQR